MKTQLVITDLTRMQHGRVCIAGYDAGGRCVRPVLRPPGISEGCILDHGRPAAFPFAVVEIALLQHRCEPPHTEDCYYDPASLRHLRVVPEPKRRAILAWSLRERVGDLFGQPVLRGPGHYVLEGRGERSLGTVRPAVIDQVYYGEGEEGAWDYRLSFHDAEEQYRLKIVDLTWHRWCDCLRARHGCAPAEAAARLTETLHAAEVYLRIGLSRYWAKFPDRCYLQITGIHTIPDYLQGKTFVDLAC